MHTETPPHDPYAALRVPAYRLFILGWFIATLGTRIQSVAVAWEMYQRTGDALSLGLVGLAQALPSMLLALPSGYLADHFNRAKLLTISQLAAVFTAISFAVISYTHASASWVYLFLVLDASAVILGRPARVALVPQLVPRAIFPNATGWNSSLMQVSSVVGPALGGLLLQINPLVAYGTTALCALSFSFLLTRIPLNGEVKPSSGKLLENFVAGARYVWQEQIIFVMIALDLFAVLLGGATYLLPIFAEDILKVGSSGFGWLRAAPAVGALCTAFLILHLPPMKRAGWTLLFCVAGFGVATIIFGLSRSFWLSFAMLFLTGAFDQVSVVIRNTLQQLLTPNEMRGRVSAVTGVFITASNELGGMESGLVAHWFGPIVSAVGGGIGTLLVVAAVGFLSPQLRAFGALHEAKPSKTVGQ